MVYLRAAAVSLLIFALAVSGVPLDQSKNDVGGESDQLVSGTTITQAVVPDVQAPAASNAKSDLKTSDSFGFGYYLPIVAPALAVKYHYPYLYYPAAYLHSIRHHGYGGFGYYHHGHAVLH